MANDVEVKKEGTSQEGSLIFVWPNEPTRSGKMGLKDTIRWGVNVKLQAGQNFSNLIEVKEADTDIVVKGVGTYSSDNGLITWKPFLGAFKKNTRYNARIKDSLIYYEGSNYGLTADANRNNITFTTGATDVSGPPGDDPSWQLGFDLSAKAQEEFDRAVSNMLQTVCPMLLLAYDTLVSVLDVFVIAAEFYLSMVKQAMTYVSVEILLKLQKMINGLNIPQFSLPSSLAVGAKISFKDYINKCPPLSKFLPAELGLALSLDLPVGDINKFLGMPAKYLKMMKKKANEILNKMIKAAFALYGTLIFAPILAYEDFIASANIDKFINQIANLEFCLMNLCRPPELPKQATQNVVKFQSPTTFASGAGSVEISSGYNAKVGANINVIPAASGEWDDFNPSSVNIPMPVTEEEKKWMKHFFYPDTTVLRSRKYMSLFGTDATGALDILKMLKSTGKSWGITDDEMSKLFKEVYKIYKGMTTLSK